MLEKLSRAQSGRTLSKKKKKENLFTYSIRRAGAISKFPDAAVQSCCFANVNLLLFSFLVAVAFVLAYAPFCCDPEILLPW